MCTWCVSNQWKSMLHLWYALIHYTAGTDVLAGNGRGNSIVGCTGKITCMFWPKHWNRNIMSRLMTKPTKWYVRPAKTQISLSIRPVWSESSLSAWRKLWSIATHWVHSEDWSDWADGQADLSLRWAHMPFCWFCHEADHMAKFWVHLRHYQGA